MKIRKLHKLVGIILLLPFIAWAVTGLVFYIKPGYAGAYEMLTPKTYPLDGSTSIRPDTSWREFRCIRTVLGDHLLARTGAGWIHLNPSTMQPRRAPTPDEVKLLLADAFTAHPDRYGTITVISDSSIQTDTGVEIILDWNTLSLQQRGKDTDRIDLLYKIHYLQWTGIRSVDKVLGLVGIVLVIVLTWLGARLALKGN